MWEMGRGRENDIEGERKIEENEDKKGGGRKGREDGKGRDG